jgi:predicted RND superfamily exporter protein
VVGLSVVPFALALIPNLRFSQDSLSWFPDDNPVKQAVGVIEAKVTGSMPVEIIIDTGKEQGVLDPEFQKNLDQWLSSLRGKELNGIPIRSINSIVDLVKETNQAFNGNKRENYVVPDDQELIAQELLLVEMDQADDLYQYTDKKFQKAHVTLILPWKDAILFAEFQRQLSDSYRQSMGEKWPDMHLTGIIPIFSTLFAAIVQSAIQSYMISGIIITLMMMLLLRNVLDGLIAMIPNLIPIMVVIAFMTVADMPMDVLTVLIGSIAVGLCVDDTIHFMHGFKVAYQKQGNAAQAIEEVLMSTGKALMITSVVLFFGFLTFVLSDLSSMDNFGILTAMCIVLALLFDFFLGPALMMIRYGKKKSV